MTAELAFDGGISAIPCCLSVGVTGHRRAALNGDHDLRRRLDAILCDLRDAAARLHVAEADAFAAVALPPRLICPLAEGADQFAAAAALDLGYDLHAILPFRRHDYADDFPEAAALTVFDALLDRAARTLELPCRRGDVPSAYALAGRATVAHSDVVLAVWDGLPARGAGGTAEIVVHVLRRGGPKRRSRPTAPRTARGEGKAPARHPVSRSRAPSRAWHPPPAARVRPRPAPPTRTACAPRPDNARRSSDRVEWWRLCPHPWPRQG